jgi:hypothetical protein
MNLHLAPQASLLLLALALAVGGCSKGESPTIVGHWRAERVQILSAHLPIGPDIIVGDHDVTSADGEISIPVESIEAKHNEAVVDFAYGVGLSFYFDGADRMYVDVPLAGKIYYRRVKDDQHNEVVAHVAIQSVQRPVAPAPGTDATGSVGKSAIALPVVNAARQNADEALIRQAEALLRSGQYMSAEASLTEAGKDAAAHPAVDYDLAILKIRQSDADSAIRYLGDAFSHGFRRFDLLDGNADFDSLRSDVRYTALVSRYR